MRRLLFLVLFYPPHLFACFFRWLSDFPYTWLYRENSRRWQEAYDKAAPEREAERKRILEELSRED